MIYTESDAKKKACHVKLQRSVGWVDGNYWMCLGSGCMAWEWMDGLQENRRGYCGLLVQPNLPIETKNDS